MRGRGWTCCLRFLQLFVQLQTQHQSSETGQASSRRFAIPNTTTTATSCQLSLRGTCKNFLLLATWASHVRGECQITTAHRATMPADGDGQTNDVEAVKLYAAGFNAHQQLLDFDDDVRSLTLMVEAVASTPRQVLFAGWSTTIFQAGKHIYSLGHQELPPAELDDDVVMQCGFGDHEGMSGCVDRQGRLYLVEESEDSPHGMKLICKTTDDASPKIGTIAHAGNGRVALTFKQAPNGNLCHVAEFESREAFVRWFKDPSGEGNYPESHHMLPGRPKQLLANTGTFLLLMESGDVHSWGDARYQSLGRPIIGDEATPADKPAAVDALGGLQISKIASSGWLNAALSADGALYVWGSTSPGGGDERSILCLEDQGAGQVALVTIPDSDSEPLDILDVAVGDDHICAIAEGGRLFVVGDNRNGQLGLDSEESFVEDWEEVFQVSQAKTIWCGPKSTFVLSGSSQQQRSLSS